MTWSSWRNDATAAARLGRSPDSYAESFALAAEVGVIDGELAARLRPAAGMRNVLVHAYLEVDHDIVAGSIPGAIVDFTDYARQVAARFSSTS